MASWTQTSTSKNLAQIDQLAPVVTSELGARDQWNEGHKAAREIIRSGVLGDQNGLYTLVLSGYNNDNGHEGSTKDSIIVNLTRL